MVDKNLMTDMLEIKLARLVLEFKELGCTMLKEKQDNGRWTVSVSTSEDRSN